MNYTSNKKRIYIYPHNDRWSVKKANAKRPSRVFDKKSDAIKYGKYEAQKNKYELIGQKKNGRINLKNSYGNDPRDEKG